MNLDRIHVDEYQRLDQSREWDIISGLPGYWQESKMAAPMICMKHCGRMIGIYLSILESRSKEEKVEYSNKFSDRKSWKPWQIFR